MTEQALSAVRRARSKRRWEYLPLARRPALSPARADAGSRATGQTPHSSCAWARCPAAGITVSGPEPCFRPGRPRDTGSAACLRRGGDGRGSDRATVREKPPRGLRQSTPRPIPDLIPTLCALASVAEGETRVINAAARLRIKESDRLLDAPRQLLRGLGGRVEELPDGLCHPGRDGARGRHGRFAAMTTASPWRRPCAPALTRGHGRGAGRASAWRSPTPRFWDDLSRLKGEKV